LTSGRFDRGIKLDQRGFHLWRIKDGKAIEFHYFPIATSWG
jgi:hypothetical protein